MIYCNQQTNKLKYDRQIANNCTNIKYKHTSYPNRCYRNVSDSNTVCEGAFEYILIND